MTCCRVSGSQVFWLPDFLWKVLQHLMAFAASRRGCEQESGDPGTLFPHDVGADAIYSFAAASGFVSGFSVPLSSAFST